MNEKLTIKKGLLQSIFFLLSLVFIVAFTQSEIWSDSIVDQTEDLLALGFPDSRKIVQDSKGSIYVGYRKKFKQDKKTQNHIFLAKSEDGGVSWTVLNNHSIENVGDYQQRVPSLAVDSQDSLHVIWYGNDADHPENDNHQIKYVRSSDGGRSWSNWRNIAPVEGYDGGSTCQEHPVLSIDGADRLNVVWQGKDALAGKASQIKFAKSLDRGKNWTPPLTIGKLNGASRPTILCGSDNKTLYVLAYGKLDQREQILWTDSSDGGATWSSWKEVAPSLRDQRHVSCAIDSHDHLYAVWREVKDDSGKSQVFGAVYDGRSWIAPTLIAPNKEMFQSFPSVNVDEFGQVTVIWTESPFSPREHDNPSPGQVICVIGSGGPQWGTRQVLASENKNVFASLLSGARGGRLHAAVWLRQSTPNSILFNTLPNILKEDPGTIK